MEYRTYTLYWNNEEMHIDFEEDLTLARQVAAHLLSQSIDSYLSHIDRDGEERYAEYFETETERAKYERIRQK